MLIDEECGELSEKIAWCSRPKRDKISVVQIAKTRGGEGI